MIKTTRWSPDTCKCVMEYEWDDTVAEDQRQHAFTRVVSKCDYHSGMGEDQEHYDHVVHENNAKNRVHAEILKNQRLTRVRKNERNEDVTELAEGVEFQWHFTGKDRDRELIVQVKGAQLTEQEKQKLKDIKENRKVVRII